MINTERQKTVFKLLKNFQGIEPLRELFWAELSCERVNQPLSTRDWKDTASKNLADDPLLFAAGGQDNAFSVIYACLSSDGLPIT